MSAEQCGPVFGIVLVSPAVSQEETPTSISTESRWASETLDRIRARRPHFYPMDDSEIWMRARAYGMMDEQD